MRSSRPRPRRLRNRHVRSRLAYWFAGPVAAGIVLVLATLAGTPMTGPGRWLTIGLSLSPAVLVHCHNRDQHFTWPQTIAVGLGAAVVAYAVIIVGVLTGATLRILVTVAAQTGTLAAIAQLVGILGFAVTVAHKRRPACTAVH